MSDRFSLHAVLAELIDQLAGQYKIEKLVHLLGHCRMRGVLPRCSPEHGKHLHAGQQWPIAIRELGSDRGGCQRRRMQRHDPPRVRELRLRRCFLFAVRFGDFLGFGSWCHGPLLLGLPGGITWAEKGARREIKVVHFAREVNGLRGAALQPSRWPSRFSQSRGEPSSLDERRSSWYKICSWARRLSGRSWR